MRSRARPTCSRSMRRWRRRVRATPVAVSRWWRPRYAASPSAPRRPPGHQAALDQQRRPGPRRCRSGQHRGRGAWRNLSSIDSVAEIVADIAAASGTQTDGLEQVNKALAQMDDVTQQTPRWCKRTPSVRVLDQQAQAMNERVSLFQLRSAPAEPQGRELPRWRSRLRAFSGKVDSGFPFRKCDNAKMLERFLRLASVKPL